MDDKSFKTDMVFKTFQELMTFCKTNRITGLVGFGSAAVDNAECGVVVDDDRNVIIVDGDYIIGKYEGIMFN